VNSFSVFSFGNFIHRDNYTRDAIKKGFKKVESTQFRLFESGGDVTIQGERHSLERRCPDFWRWLGGECIVESIEKQRCVCSSYNQVLRYVILALDDLMKFPFESEIDW
jgi:hypothetical protein